MFNLIVEVALLVWTTSAMFMIYFSIHNTLFALTIEEPLPNFSFIKFIYYHFCPIINTYKCFKVIQNLTRN